MDISDGLATDAPRLARASGLLAEIDARSIPVAPAARIVFGARTAARFAATGGEDFELLIAAPRARRVEAAFRRRFGVALTAIGVLRPGRGVCWSRDPGRAFRHW